MYCLFAVMWCKATESHTCLSESLMLFTLTAQNAEPLVMSSDDAPTLCCRWFILVSFHFSTILFQMANLVTMNIDVVFSILCGLLLRTTWFTRRVLITNDWDFVVDVCATNALHFATVTDVWNRFSIVQFLMQAVCRSLVIRRLPDVPKLLLLRSHQCQHVSTQQLNRYVVRLSSTQLWIHVPE
jgi:hypothetical protein